MRSDLTKLEGVSHIDTDLRTHRCKFYLTNKTLDLAASLDGFAKTNEHIEGWKLVSRVEPPSPAEPADSNPDSTGNQPKSDQQPDHLDPR